MGRLLRQGKRLKGKGKRNKFNLSPYSLPFPHALCPMPNDYEAPKQNLLYMVPLVIADY
ncbi:hypothetical protein NSTC745_00746 [Nostoc sp. DSM 114161]|jgi:hypothetical protein